MNGFNTTKVKILKWEIKFIKRDSTSHLLLFKNFENDSKVTKLGSIRVKAERHRFYVWISKKKGFLHSIVIGPEKWIHYDQNNNNFKMKKIMGAPQPTIHWQLSQISKVWISCCVFDGTSSTGYIMNCCNWVKLSLELINKHNEFGSSIKTKTVIILTKK